MTTREILSSGVAVTGDATRPRPGFYRPELDALRFFAFLCIFFHHTLGRGDIRAAAHPYLRDAFTDSLKFAVSLFFLLSGYLITMLLVMEKELSGHVHIWSFYRRRIARIWPLYYSFVVFVMLSGIAVAKVEPPGYALPAFLFFSGNWFLISFGGLAGGLGILWSVNIEEQLYLFWPWGMKSDRWALVAAGILATSYLMLLWLGARGHYTDLTLRFNTLVEMQYFAAGALLAALLPRHGWKMPFGLRVLSILFGICCWVGGVRFLTFFNGATMQTRSAWWAPSALFASVLAGCLVLFLGFYGIPADWLPRPLLWLGKISYGLYVYHSLVLALMPRWPSGYGLARIGVELLLTISIAGLSYRWLEKPFLRWREHFTFVPNRPA